MATKIVCIDEEDAKILTSLIKAFRPIHEKLGVLNVDFVGLRLADGSSRTLKLITATKEDGAPSSPVPDNSGPPTGYHEETITLYDEDCVEFERIVLVKDS